MIGFEQAVVSTLLSNALKKNKMRFKLRSEGVYVFQVSVNGVWFTVEDLHAEKPVGNEK